LLTSRANLPSGAWPVAGGVAVLAVALMAWDHLWGNEGGADSFPVDAATFLLALGLVVAAVLLVFGVTVPRAARHASGSHKAALIHSGAAFLLAVPLSWLGFPVVVAGGGIALGLQARTGPHSRVATAAVVLGVLVVAFAVIATAFPPTDAD
jgi:hypothetical protein